MSIKKFMTDNKETEIKMLYLTVLKGQNKNTIEKFCKRLRKAIYITFLKKFKESSAVHF